MTVEYRVAILRRDTEVVAPKTQFNKAIRFLEARGTSCLSTRSGIPSVNTKIRFISVGGNHFQCSSKVCYQSMFDMDESTVYISCYQHAVMAENTGTSGLPTGSTEQLLKQILLRLFIASKLST